MGGDYAEKVEQVAPATGTGTASPSVAGKSTIEIHQKGSEVHFHDRTNKLKAAVPVSDWFAAWSWLQHAEFGKEPFIYFDAKEQTRLTVTTGWGISLEEIPRVFARITIEKVGGANDAYQALHSFMKKATGGK